MTDTWLSAPEQRAWRAFLGLHRELNARLNRQLQADSGLSLSDYEVLVVLSESDEGRMRPFELCDFLQWEQSRLSHHIRRMESRGLVSREGCTGDGRGAFVVLSDAGRKAIEAAAPSHAAAGPAAAVRRDVRGAGRRAGGGLHPVAARDGRDPLRGAGG